MGYPVTWNLPRLQDFFAFQFQHHISCLTSCRSDVEHFHPTRNATPSGRRSCCCHEDLVAKDKRTLDAPASDEKLTSSRHTIQNQTRMFPPPLSRRAPSSPQLPRTPKTYPPVARIYHRRTAPVTTAQTLPPTTSIPSLIHDARPMPLTSPASLSSQRPQ